QPVRCDCLWQVVAERRPHHVIHRVRRDTCHPAWQGAAATRPAVPVEVRVLHAELHSPLFPLIELIPEAKAAFPDVPGVSVAVAASGRCAGSAGGGLDTLATGIGGAGVAIAAESRV